jgi:hypothetical protein
MPVQDQVDLLPLSSSNSRKHNRAKKERKGLRSHNPFKGTPPMTLRAKPHLLEVPPPPNSVTLGTRSLIHGVLEDIQGPNFLLWEEVTGLTNTKSLM